MACEFNKNIECSCAKKDCVNHGKCCECVKRHRDMGNLPACLRHIENVVSE